MRKDIEIHINTKDVAMTSSSTFKPREFRWVENEQGLSRYIYGEVDIPYTTSEASIRANGFYVEIPYTPKYKEFMVRVRRVYGDGSSMYLTNRKDGSEWFLATTGWYGGKQENLYASQLYELGKKSFYISIANEVAEVYASTQTDFNIANAERQNANCLLACIPTNNYRYPLTGIGLVRWINSAGINNSELAAIIQQEFSDDGVTVKNASYDYDTCQMELDIDATNTD